MQNNQTLIILTNLNPIDKQTLFNSINKLIKDNKKIEVLRLKNTINNSNNYEIQFNSLIEELRDITLVHNTMPEDFIFSEETEELFNHSF